MKKALVIMNHQLTQEQINALKQMEVEQIDYLPDDLQAKIKNIPPEWGIEDIVQNVVEPIYHYIYKNYNYRDIIILQGEFGFTWQLLDNLYWAKYHNVFYATTKRKVIEEVVDSKVIKKSIFKFVRFRKYFI